MILSCSNKEGMENTFIVGVDREWRDGMFFWGGKGCFLLELKPSFTMLRSKRKLQF